MAHRIAVHRARRGDEWTTAAAPTELCEAIKGCDGTGPILVDCLTLWLTNLILADTDWEAEVEALAGLTTKLASPIVFVTNEVGLGIVPDNQLARRFRDAAGIMNQKMASACDELWLCVSGHPMRVKPQ